MNTGISRPATRLAPVSFGLLLLLLAAVLQPAWAGNLAAPARQTPDVPLPYSSAPDYPDAGLEEAIEDSLQGVAGNWAVAVKKLDTGQYAAVNAQTPAVSASLYKLFVFYEVMRQRNLGMLSLDDVETITEANASYDESIGALQWTIGQQVTIADLIDQMITVSDNTAALTLVSVVGWQNVNASLQKLGLHDSALDFSGGDNMTTAADYTRLLDLIATGQVLDRDSCRYMIGELLKQQVNYLIPPGLPDDIPFAHKTGTLDFLRHDAGIVYGASGPFVITIMSWNLDANVTAEIVMPKIAQNVYAYFNDRPSQPARYFPETQQVVGPAFLLFYNSNGGQPIFGLPISPETLRGDQIVQYFERARMERPADGGPITLGLIGSELTAAQGRQFDPTAAADPGDPNTAWFAATQQAIGQPFLSYWRQHGGQALFGLPISNVMTEQHGGQNIRVQYFERARFELHGDSIQLGLIGSELLALQR